MSRMKKIMSLCMAAAMIATVAGCDESAGTPANTSGAGPGTSATTTAATTTDPDEGAKTDEEAKVVVSEDWAPDGTAGTVKYLGYYDIREGSDQYLTFQTPEWGGTIEYSSCSSGAAYFEKLGTLIAADDSPDLVTYEWLSFPGGMAKNMYEPLDEWFDLESSLWKDMKATAETFAYEGKHYYYPYQLRTYFALNYNRKTIENAGLEDPYDLYMAGNWTWDTWRQMMIDFCNQDETNIGYCSTPDVLTSIVATTGTNFVDVQSDGTIKNNLNDANVTRAMEFIENLYRDGLFYNKELGDWVSPQLWAVNSSQVLFLGMEPSWCYSDSTKIIQNPNGVENDVFDTPSDFAFVPFPRDPASDTYYMACDSFGYMVPKGAKNVKGAVDWIYCNRIFETDVNVQAKAKQEAIAPEKVTFVEGKYAGMQKWQMTWDEQVYDLYMEMKDPTKFTYNFDDVYGFNSQLSSDLVGNMLNEVMFNAGSWTQLTASNSPAVEAILDEYR